jgi:DNA/RNA-binding domain of Phe-tRNA-synthetase-like protein
LFPVIQGSGSKLELNIEESLTLKFPGLRATICTISGVVIQKSNPALSDLRQTVENETRGKYTLETVRDVAIFRAYRDFFWRIGIDPTKIRPAAEALVRRVLAGKTLPNINTLVDAYNLASIRTSIALAAFDQAKLHGNLLMRFAHPSEHFLGIGMDEPMELGGREVVVADDENLVAVYPYRDADGTKVTEATRDLILMTCGCPGITDTSLGEAERLASEFILKFCGGKRQK